MKYNKVDDRHFFHLDKSATVVVLTEIDDGLIVSAGEWHAENNEVRNVETMMVTLAQEKQE